MWYDGLFDRRVLNSVQNDMDCDDIEQEEDKFRRLLSAIVISFRGKLLNSLEHLCLQREEHQMEQSFCFDREIISTIIDFFRAVKCDGLNISSFGNFSTARNEIPYLLSLVGSEKGHTFRIINLDTFGYDMTIRLLYLVYVCCVEKNVEFISGLTVVGHHHDGYNRKEQQEKCGDNVITKNGNEIITAPFQQIIIDVDYHSSLGDETEDYKIVTDNETIIDARVVARDIIFTKCAFYIHDKITVSAAVEASAASDKIKLAKQLETMLEATTKLNKINFHLYYKKHLDVASLLALRNKLLNDYDCDILYEAYECFISFFESVSSSMDVVQKLATKYFMSDPPAFVLDNPSNVSMPLARKHLSHRPVYIESLDLFRLDSVPTLNFGLETFYNFAPINLPALQWTTSAGHSDNISCSGNTSTYLFPCLPVTLINNLFHKYLKHLHLVEDAPNNEYTSREGQHNNVNDDSMSKEDAEVYMQHDEFPVKLLMSNDEEKREKILICDKNEVVRVMGHETRERIFKTISKEFLFRIALYVFSHHVNNADNSGSCLVTAKEVAGKRQLKFYLSNTLVCEINLKTIYDMITLYDLINFQSACAYDVDDLGNSVGGDISIQTTVVADCMNNENDGDKNNLSKSQTTAAIDEFYEILFVANRKKFSVENVIWRKRLEKPSPCEIEQERRLMQQCAKPDCNFTPATSSLLNEGHEEATVSKFTMGKREEFIKKMRKKFNFLSTNTAGTMTTIRKTTNLSKRAGELYGKQTEMEYDLIERDNCGGGAGSSSSISECSLQDNFDEEEEDVEILQTNDMGNANAINNSSVHDENIDEFTPQCFNSFPFNEAMCIFLSDIEERARDIRSETDFFLFFKNKVLTMVLDYLKCTKNRHNLYFPFLYLLSANSKYIPFKTTEDSLNTMRKYIMSIVPGLLDSNSNNSSNNKKKKMNNLSLMMSDNCHSGGSSRDDIMMMGTINKLETINDGGIVYKVPREEEFNLLETLLLICLDYGAYSSTLALLTRAGIVNKNFICLFLFATYGNKMSIYTKYVLGRLATMNDSDDENEENQFGNNHNEDEECVGQRKGKGVGGGGEEDAATAAKSVDGRKGGTVGGEEEAEEDDYNFEIYEGKSFGFLNFFSGDDIMHLVFHIVESEFLNLDTKTPGIVVPKNATGCRKDKILILDQILGYSHTKSFENFLLIIDSLLHTSVSTPRVKNTIARRELMDFFYTSICKTQHVTHDLLFIFSRYCHEEHENTKEMKQIKFPKYMPDKLENNMYYVENVGLYNPHINNFEYGGPSLCSSVTRKLNEAQINTNLLKHRFYPRTNRFLLTTLIKMRYFYGVCRESVCNKILQSPIIPLIFKESPQSSSTENVILNGERCNQQQQGGTADERSRDHDENFIHFTRENSQYSFLPVIEYHNDAEIKLFVAIGNDYGILQQDNTFWNCDFFNVFLERTNVGGGQSEFSNNKFLRLVKRWMLTFYLVSKNYNYNFNNLSRFLRLLFVKGSSGGGENSGGSFTSQHKILGVSQVYLNNARKYRRAEEDRKLQLRTNNQESVIGGVTAAAAAVEHEDEEQPSMSNNVSAEHTIQSILNDLNSHNSGHRRHQHNNSSSSVENSMKCQEKKINFYNPCGNSSTFYEEAQKFVKYCNENVELEKCESLIEGLGFDPQTFLETAPLLEQFQGEKEDDLELRENQMGKRQHDDDDSTSAVHSSKIWKANKKIRLIKELYCLKDMTPAAAASEICISLQHQSDTNVHGSDDGCNKINFNFGQGGLNFGEGDKIEALLESSNPNVEKMYREESCYLNFCKTGRIFSKSVDDSAADNNLTTLLENLKRPNCNKDDYENDNAQNCEYCSVPQMSSRRNGFNLNCKAFEALLHLDELYYERHENLLQNLVDCSRSNEGVVKFAILFTNWTLKMGSNHCLSKLGIFKSMRKCENDIYEDMVKLLEVSSRETFVNAATRKTMCRQKGDGGASTAKKKLPAAKITTHLTFTNNTQLASLLREFCTGGYCELDLDKELEPYAELAAQHPLYLTDSQRVQLAKSYPQYFKENQLDMHIDRVMLRMCKKYLYNGLAFMSVLSEFKYDNFMDLLKFCCSCMFKGNTNRKGFYLRGQSTSGKSYFADLLCQIFNTGFTNTLPSSLLKRAQNQDYDMACTPMARNLFVLFDEISAYSCKDRVKCTVNNIATSTRNMHSSESHSMLPSCKVMLTSNHLISIEKAILKRFDFCKKDIMLGVPNKFEAIDRLCFSSHCKRTPSSIGAMLLLNRMPGQTKMEEKIGLMYLIDLIVPIFYHTNSRPVSQRVSKTALNELNEIERTHDPITAFQIVNTIEYCADPISQKTLYDVIENWWRLNNQHFTGWKLKDVTQQIAAELHTFYLKDVGYNICFVQKN